MSTSVHMKQISAALLCLAALLASANCKKSIPANVAAMVNGRPITFEQLNKQFELQFAGGERPNDDQMMIQKLQLLNSIVDSEIMLQRSENASLMASYPDEEAKLNELKAPYTQEEFQKQLTARKMTPDELKAQIRRELSVQ